MRLKDIMSTDVITVEPAEAANAAWSRMDREGVRHLVVTEAGRLLGVISERDLGGRTGGSVRRGRTVRDLMTPQVATATPDTTLRKAANLMHGRLIGSLPVLTDGRLVGIVTATDVLQALGRGSSRPTARAERRSMRLPPASTRRAAAERAGQKAKGAKRARNARSRSVQSAKSSSGPDEGERAPSRALAKPMLAESPRGGDRERRPDSPRRAPMAASVARPAKRTAGRTAAEDTPAHIRAVGVSLDAADKAYLRRKLGRKLGKFAGEIERASVRIEDVNGPRGGIDKRCRIKVVLSGLPSIVAEERHRSLQGAMDGALARAERAVRRAAVSHRSRPRRSTRYGARTRVRETSTASTKEE